MAGIADYIEARAGELTTSNTFLQGNAFDFNLDADDVSTFPVVYFFNLLTEGVQLTQSQIIRFQEFPILITFAEKSIDLDQTPSNYNTSFETMKDLAKDFMVKVLQSDEYKNANTTELPLYTLEPFIDRTDTGLIGVILSTTLQLKLTGYDCTGL